MAPSDWSAPAPLKMRRSLWSWASAPKCTEAIAAGLSYFTRSCHSDPGLRANGDQPGPIGGKRLLRPGGELLYPAYGRDQVSLIKRGRSWIQSSLPTPPG